MAITRNYDDYITRMEREGISAYDASQLDGAHEAHALDQQAEWAADAAKTKGQWLQADAKGFPRVAFTTQDEMVAAINDPRYKTMPGYRDAVQDCIGRMEHVGIAISDGRANVQDDLNGETMLKAARKDAAIATYKKLSVEAAHDPVKRLELLELMHSKDEAVQAWLNEGTGAVANEGPLQKAFREKGFSSFGSDLNKAMASEEGEDNNGSDPNNSPAGGDK